VTIHCHGGWRSSFNVRLVGKDDDARQNVARSTNWKTLQPWEAEKNGIEVYTRIHSFSIPALMSVTFMLWNWVLPYFEARSLASQCAVGGSRSIPR
jgi:hypothetical protein